MSRYYWQWTKKNDNTRYAFMFKMGWNQFCRSILIFLYIKFYWNFLQFPLFHTNLFDIMSLKQNAVHKYFLIKQEYECYFIINSNPLWCCFHVWNWALQRICLSFTSTLTSFLMFLQQFLRRLINHQTLEF